MIERRAPIRSKAFVLREAGIEVPTTPVRLADGSLFRPGEDPDPEG
ncbi:MAG: hypothetical protein KC731_00530 [Myxococcales bacterium]|nr:hypothetical protein [Myxococcales bacterium]